MPWALVALALAVRLWHIDLTRFYDDQVGLLRATNDLIDHPHIPAHAGIAFSIGVWLPPLVSMLLAIPSLISRDPVWLSGCMALVDSLGAWLVFLTARKLTGSGWPALAAGLMYAVAPAGFIFGRMIWNANFIPVLAAVALWGLTDFQVCRRSSSLAVALVAIGGAAQLHPVNAIYGVIWIVVALSGIRYIRWRLPVAGFLLLVLMVAPYVRFEMQTGWQDLQNFRAFLGGPKQTDLAALDRAIELTGPTLFARMQAGGDSPDWFHFDPVTWVSAALALAGASFAIASRKGPQIMVAAWLAVPIVFALHHTTHVWNWYFLGEVPAVCILQGVATFRVAGWSAKLPRCGWRVRATRRWVALPVCLVAAVPVLVSVDFARMQDDVAANVRVHGYGIPLRYSAEAARQLQSVAGQSPVYLAGPPDWSGVIPYLAGLQLWRRYNSDSVVVLPNQESWYMVQADTQAERFFDERVGQPASVVKTSSGAPEFELFQVPAGTQFLSEPGFAPAQADIGKGLIEFLGYRAGDLRAGSPSTVDLMWRVTDARTLEPLHFSQFAHLVDGTGRTWSRAGDLYNVIEPWRNEDLVVWPADLNILPDAPTGGYWLETGFYETFSQHALPLVRDGKDIGTSIRLGPLRVAGLQPAVSQQPIGAFGEEGLQLLRADWRGEDVRLQWRAANAPRNDYTVFVHALDSAGRLIAQHDGLPQQGAFPTSLWQPGDVVNDVHHLGMQAKSGIRLEVGLYTQPSLQRVMARQGGQTTDHLTIEQPAG